MQAFAEKCLLRCQFVAKEQFPQMLIFQSLAAAYTVFFLGAFFLFTRPGASHEFHWERAQRKNVGLGTTYVSSPALLHVPAPTALMYYAVWAICLIAKVSSYGGHFLQSTMLHPQSPATSPDRRCSSATTS